MRELEISFITEWLSDTNLKPLSNLLEQKKKQHIDNLLWTSNGYLPKVSFFMAYTGRSLLLKFKVKEQHVSAVYREINDPIYKDSCVEMFIAFNSEVDYYNLEFNCLGTAMVGYGSGKKDRLHVSRQLIEKIKSYQVFKTNLNALDLYIEWELTLEIPFGVFEHHQISSLKGHVFRANFYKCGDDLQEPHFLSWNNIINPYPNFHLPEFFGRVSCTSQ